MILPFSGSDRGTKTSENDGFEELNDAFSSFLLKERVLSEREPKGGADLI